MNDDMHAILGPFVILSAPIGAIIFGVKILELDPDKLGNGAILLFLAAAALYGATVAFSKIPRHR